MHASVNAQTHTIETLSNTPLWMLESFCRENRVAIVVSHGKITEIVGGDK